MVMIRLRDGRIIGLAPERVGLVLDKLQDDASYEGGVVDVRPVVGTRPATAAAKPSLGSHPQRGRGTQPGSGGTRTGLASLLSAAPCHGQGCVVCA
jgi:hypothetical protein